MKIEYKNPEKKRGVLIWEMEVSFLSREGDFKLQGVSDEELMNRAKILYGNDYEYFLSVNHTNSFLVWMSQIKNWESQKVISVDYGVKETKSYKDKENENLINFYDFSQNILGKKNLKISFTLESYEVELNADVWETKDYNTSSDLFRRYTKSERQLGQTDSIASKAKEITKEVSGSFSRAKLIYEWITSNIEDEKTKTRRGAIRVFETKKGNIAEMNFLCITMMRSVGIPARLVTGAGGEMDKKQEVHFWMEFYLQDVGWVPVDCVKKTFGKIDNKRIIFSKGENILLDRAPMQSNFFGINYERTFFMEPEAIYLNKHERGVFAIKRNKYILIKR